MVEIHIEGKDNEKEINSNKQRVLDKIKNSNNFLMLGAVIVRKKNKKISNDITATKGVIERFMCVSGSTEESLMMLSAIQELIKKYVNETANKYKDDMDCNTCDNYDSCDKPYKKEK